MGLLKRGGKVFTGIVANCSRAEREPVIKGQVLSKAAVFTDGWPGDDRLLLSGYKHHRMPHHEHEFARGKNHINGPGELLELCQVSLRQAAWGAERIFPAPPSTVINFEG